MIRVLLATALLASAAVAAADDEEEWYCYGAGDYEKKDVLVTLFHYKSMGSVAGNGFGYDAHYLRDGLDHQWVFGEVLEDGSFRFAFSIEPDGTGKYYVNMGDGSMTQKNWYRCDKIS